MRYTIIIEDKPNKGVCVSYIEGSNGIQDHPPSSLAAHTTASLALTLKRLADIGALHITQQTLVPSKG